jgi:transglutaminase-like putative cysteine protease
MKFKMSCDLAYRVVEETVLIFNLEVAPLAAHGDLLDRMVLTPDLPRRTYMLPDVKNRYTGVVAPPGDFRVSYAAEVDLVVHRADPASVNETPVRDLPLDKLPFLLPSRFVPSDRLCAFALREFGHLPRGHSRVSTICSWIYRTVTYEPGSSDAATTADETLLRRAGVCRDFAHLGIAFCRALGIPARFVSCYAYGLDPADFHAVFEAYLDGRWWLFDATRQAALDGLVRIGVGRDAAEVAFCTPYGRMEPGEIRISIGRADGQPESGQRTVEAISTEELAPATS